MPLEAKELPFFDVSYDLEPLDAMRPARIALPLLAVGFLLAPSAARAPSRRSSFQTGIDLMQKGRDAEALSVFRKLTDEDPSFLEAWNNRAALEAASGNLEAAQISLQKALSSRLDVSVINRNLEKVRSRLARLAYDSAFGTPSNLAPLALDVQREAIPLLIDSSGLQQRDSLKRELARLREASQRDLGRKDSLLAGREAEIRRLRTELERSSATVVASAQTPGPVVVAQASPPATVASEPTTARPLVVEKPPESIPAVPVKIAVAAPSPADKPKPLAKAPETSAAVLDMLHAWTQSWSSQQVDQYLSYYSDRFTPVGKPDRKSWEDYRRERISAPKSIRVEVVSPKIRLLKDHLAEVVYRQVYQTEDSRLTSRKRLELVWEHGVWRILSEKEAR